MLNRIKYLVLFVIINLVIVACDEDTGGPSKSEEIILSGGENFTTFNFSENAFGVQGSALTRDESRLFVSGNSLFRNNWVQAVSSVESLDGLGPVFNAISCGSCHFKDGRAAPPDEFNVVKPGLLFRIAINGSSPHGAPTPHPIYGGQIQDRSLPNIPAEASITTRYEIINGTYADGTEYILQKPIYSLEDLAYGDINEVYNLSPRIAPQVAGLGLLEAITEADILSNQDENDADQDGISGRINMVWDVESSSLRIGRFGWKANQPNVNQQNAGAFNGDLGLTTNLFPDDDFTETQIALYPGILNGGEPEVSDEQLSRVTLYVKALAVPARRNTSDAMFLEGEAIFANLSCNSCHVESYTTGIGNSPSSLDDQKIYPYTDLLLHDMGENLADNSEDFRASGSEWKTPPLWGIGLIRTVNGHTRLLHDGRARNIEEAILWHGGEALGAKEKFTQLTKSERESLLFYLNSI